MTAARSMAQFLVGGLVLILVGAGLGLLGEGARLVAKWVAGPLLIVLLIPVLLQFLRARPPKDRE